MSKKLNYLVIELGFLFLVGLASLRVETLQQYPPYVLAIAAALMGFAVFRSARTISYNAVMAWFREPFCEVVADSSGAGDSVEPKKGSVFGELIACPICSGTWAALVLINILLYFPKFGFTLIAVLGFAGISEFIHWAAEANEWKGREARETSGSLWLAKNGNGGAKS